MKPSIYISILVALIILAIIMLPKFFKNRNNNFDPEKANQVIKKLDKAEFPITIGSTGKEVAYLQTELNRKFSAGLTIDGIWGNNTDREVRKYLSRASFDSLDDINQALNQSAEQNYSENWHAVLFPWLN